jgi:DNA topoisomerase-1
MALKMKARSGSMQRKRTKISEEIKQKDAGQVFLFNLQTEKKKPLLISFRPNMEKVHELINEPEKYARALDLVYVSDSQPGIERKKSGKGFTYFISGKKLESPEDLERIKKLVIPPAWEQVWICCHPNGHLQATGLDARKRKQYRYHSLWNHHRNETKFHRMIEFGKILPKLRQKVRKDICQKELTQNKVIATVISVMERTFIRIGNNEYEKEYGSYGLTTLKNHHVKIKGHTLYFSFKGKKGVHHKVTLRSKRLARIVKQCRDIPGKELFEYYNENGEANAIDSGKVNSYIKEITGGDFTAKDFRTWAGTLHALRSLSKKAPAETEADLKKNILETLDEVSSLLGNTRAVCRKYYVNPRILQMYENRTLSAYLKDLDLARNVSGPARLTPSETVLMKILKLKK